jgi:hypothetical protein
MLEVLCPDVYLEGLQMINGNLKIMEGVVGTTTVK